MPSNHYVTLILIMFGSGLLGGISNYFILFDANNSGTVTKKGFLVCKSLVLGLTASFMVPLFLMTISSELLAKPAPDTFNKNYLVLAGFCLLASVLSKQFIEGLYQKVMKAEAKADRAEAKANKVTEQLETVENKFSETEGENSGLNPVTENTYTDLEKMVLDAFKNVTYIYRSTTGITNYISETSPIEKIEVKKLLNDMVLKGILITKVNDKGHILYAIKTSGKTLS